MERQMEILQQNGFPPRVKDNYEWIVLAKDYHNDRKKMLRKIRSHAMRGTAASRKKSGTWGKQNQLQYPVACPSGSEYTSSDFSEAATDSSEDQDSEAHSLGKEIVKNSIYRPFDDDLTCELNLGLSMPLSGLDQLAAEIGINVLDLSALTTVHIGQEATTFLKKNPNGLVNLVRNQRPSYLTHVTTRYGCSDCLDDAIRCVATKAHRVLTASGKGDRAIELNLYGKALRSLQSAIDLEDGWKNPNILCAVQVLSLYEVCNSSLICLDLDLNPSCSRYLSSQIRVHGQII
jgi:hypothetical protein